MALSLLSAGAGDPRPTPRGGQFEVGTEGYAFTKASVAARPAGGFVVAWTSFVPFYKSYTWARELPPGGPPVDPPLELFYSYTFHGSFIDRPQPVPVAGGGFVVVAELVDTYYSPNSVFSMELDASGEVVDSHLIGHYDYQTEWTHHTQPSVAHGDDGEMIVVWSVANGAFEFGILGRRLDANGAPLDEEFPVDAAPVSTRVNHPSVAKHSDGGFLVVWDGPDSAGDGILGRRFDATGTPSTGEIPINELSAGDQIWPVTASLGELGFVVVWEDDGRDGSGLGLFGRRTAPDGTPLGGDFPINQATFANQRQPAVAPAGSGFVVAWTDGSGLDGDSYGVFLRHFDADGRPRGGQVQVNEVSAGIQDFPSVAASGPDEVTVVWRSFTEGIFGRRFSLPLFEDDFESGDVSRWSAATP